MGAKLKRGSTALSSAGAGALLVLLLAGPAAGQGTSRVSVDSGGVEGNNASQSAMICPDGRYVAFGSSATNVVVGDTNGSWDIFVHDRQIGTTERVSIDSNGAQGDSHSLHPSISTNGRYVAFQSQASNLVVGDTNGTLDVFVHDRQTGITERVSTDSSGVQGNSVSASPSLSADGRHVAFESAATNLVVGDTNGANDIFVRNRQTGGTTRVSLVTGGAEANGNSSGSSISADGRYVAFESGASNLFFLDWNFAYDVFVHDRQSGYTELVSISLLGYEGNSYSLHPSISADGRHVAFDSLATDLVAGDTNAAEDVFLRDRQLGAVERLSVASNGAQGNGPSRAPSLSVDGRHVAFWSLAGNLVGGDTNGQGDIFVRDRQSGGTSRVSVASGGAQGNGGSLTPSISADGRYAAFDSQASNLVLGDTNALWDVFVRDRNAGIGWGYCSASANSTGSAAGLSASGSASSGAGDLVLSSSPVPNSVGLFFHGADQAQLPLGNGFLCTATGIVRGAGVTAGSNVAIYAYDNSDSKHSLAAFVGSTRNFQHWFRDPLGGGGFSSGSSAMSIAVLP